jgi:hypothetical protein
MRKEETLALAGNAINDFPITQTIFKQTEKRHINKF